MNYYQGLVNLSCGSLPSNVTCTFSPASLTAIGNNAAVTTMLTINTNSASPVVGALRGAGKPSATLAAIYWLPGVLLGAFLLIMRRRLRWSGRITMLAVLLLLIAASALTACGGGASSASSSLAQPGSNTFTVTATDSTGAATHNISISLTVR